MRRMCVMVMDYSKCEVRHWHMEVNEQEDVEPMLEEYDRDYNPMTCYYMTQENGCIPVGEVRFL